MAKRLSAIAGVLLLFASLVPLLAQESTVRGSLAGTVEDASGAVIVGAQVTAAGAADTRTMQTDQYGHFAFGDLHPGPYSLTVTKEGFQTASLKEAAVTTGNTTSVKVDMKPGAVSETVEVSASAIRIDPTTTSIGASLTDTFFQQIPIARDVASIFYITPGVTSGGNTGHSNPSISGASGLENMYVADGVNITDSAYGGLGVYTSGQGSVGSGINLSFIKEVSVKTSGLEPQYGQATGGVVTLVTKSGGKQYHGEIGAYFAPSQFEAQRNQIDDVRTNKLGRLLNQGTFEADGELGGYVPHLKDHLFFFGSFDPTWNKYYGIAPPAAGLASFGVMTGQADVYNYAGKLTWKLNDNHQIESSVFGDPSHTNTAQVNGLIAPLGLHAAETLNRPNSAAFSKWVYGTRNWVVRYNGTMSPTWLLNASFSWNTNRFFESPLKNSLDITDTTNSNLVHPIGGLGFTDNHDTNDRAINIDTQKVVNKLGQHTFSLGYRYERPDYTNINGATGTNGGTFTVPTVNASGGSSWLKGCAGVTDYATCPGGQQAILWSGSVRKASASCTICPLYPTGGVAGAPLIPVFVKFGRGRWDTPASDEFGRYHALYGNDSWEINKHLTVNAGLRWEQWRMAGVNFNYTFTDNWAPRLGVSFDPTGSRKTKIYGSFGRYNYQTPLDAAIRSLSSEKDVTALEFIPTSTVNGSGQKIANINPDGSINLPLDAAHLINGATGGTTDNASISANPIEAIAPGTRMMYQNEWVVGVDRQLSHGFVISGRFIYRNMPRIVEDVSGISPEAGVAGLNQNYIIVNPSPTLNIAPGEHQNKYAAGTSPVLLDASGNPIVNGTSLVRNPAFPSACPVDLNPASKTAGTATYALDPLADTNGAPFGPAGQAICWAPDANGYFGGELTPGGLPIPGAGPNGFVDPVHIYKAAEITISKEMSNNWLLRSAWRIARLTGNYEGAYRNDNGQSDPNISSLFDFTAGNYNLLGQQFAAGVLPTDRELTSSTQITYILSKTFLKGLEIGNGLTFQTGTPITDLGNHPAYGNAGEIPLGGRGAIGRTALTGEWDLHLERPFKVTEKSNLRLAADLFNLTNSKPVLNVTQSSGISFSPNPNPDYLHPNGFQRPFYARMSLRWVF